MSMRLARVLACLISASPLMLAAPAMVQSGWAQSGAAQPPGWAQSGTSPSAGQPNLPPGAAPRAAPVPYAPAKPGSPVVQQLVGGGTAPLVMRRHVHRYVRPIRHVARGAPVPFELERPALAGVTLLQPLPPPPPVPHIVVPVPAYPLESVAAAYLTPPPPIVCHHTARIRDLPDPDLYRERTLVCEPDTP